MHVLIAAIPILFQIGECRHSATREATIDAAAATRIFVTAGAGSLRVEGKPGLRQARLKGTACASDRNLLPEIELSTSRIGGDIRVHSNDQEIKLGNREYARLDLVIEVPEGLAARIEDGSGDLGLSALGAVMVIDGSGGIVADDILGSLDIEDGSGEIMISGVRGDVTIADGSGEIDVHDVQGKVDIRDSSGGVKVTKVARDVLISDSSGDIDVEDVDGAFTVRNDSNGDIEYRDVKGGVRVPPSKRRWH